MASLYDQGTFDTFQTTIQNSTGMNNHHPGLTNDQGDALNKIERALGLRTSLLGGFPDLAARLAAGGGGSSTANWLNVKDPAFGAVGNGTTIDTAAIQAALDALPATGGTVFFPPGIYPINATLSLANKTNATIAGAGWGSVIKIAGGVTLASGMFNPLNSVIRPTFRDMTFDGNRATANTVGRAINASANFAQYGTVFNCRFTGLTPPSGGAGGFSTNSHYWHIHGCQFDDIAGGAIILNSGSTYARISNNYMVGYAGQPVFDAISNQGKRHTFVNNKVNYYSDTGINMAGDGHICIGNEVWECGNSGLNTGGGQNLIIIGNSCYANGRKTADPRSNAGIRIREHTTGSQTSENCVVMGNRGFEDTTTFNRDSLGNPMSGSPAQGQLWGIEIVVEIAANLVPPLVGPPDNNIIVGNSCRGSLGGVQRLNIGPSNIIHSNLASNETLIGAGNGVPTHTANNGSLWQRMDGTGPNLYVRQNGAWVASGGSVDTTLFASVEELQESTSWTRMIDATINIPMMVAKFPMKIVAASLLHYGEPPSGNGAIATSDTNYWTVQVNRIRAATFQTIASKTTQLTGGQAVAHRTDWNFDALSFNATNQVLNPGDGVDFSFVKTGAPANWGATNGTRLILTVRYEPL